MSILEQLLVVSRIFLFFFLTALLCYFVLRLRRNVHLICLLIGTVIIIIFILALPYLSDINQIVNLTSSVAIIELTLALVWVELSKRPDLALGNFQPLIYKEHSAGINYKTGYHDKEPKPSRFLRIKEVNLVDLKFNERFSFSIDLANIGYGEIMVHEYVYSIDEERQIAIPLGENSFTERLRLITQQRYPLDIPSLYIKTAGFHKLRIEVKGMTTSCSKELWFYISKDFKRLRYKETSEIPGFLLKLLSPIIKKQLKKE